MFVDNFQGIVANSGRTIQHGGQDVQSAMLGGGRGISFEKNLRRPYIDRNGNLAVTVNTGRWTTEKGEKVPLREHRLVRDLVNNGVMEANYVTNATALRKEEWDSLDRTVLRAARYRLRAWADLMAKNPYGGFNGMSKSILEWETMSDVGEALVDMDGLSEGRDDSPAFQLEGLPLPITHSDFWIGSRQLAESRNSGTPLDVNKGEMAGRRCGESLEKTTIGVQTGITYGGNSTQVGGYGRTSSVYGYTNFGARLTKTGLRAPTRANWTASQTLADVLNCLDLLKANKFFGPYMIYTSNDWDQYMDNDYILTGGNVATQTLRNRLRAIEGVDDVKRLDFLFSVIPETNAGIASGVNGSGYPTGYRGPGGENISSTYAFTMIIAQMTPDVVQAVNGLDMTVLQWESSGGMRLNFKAFTIGAPRFRADFYGNCGVMQATFNG